MNRLWRSEGRTIGVIGSGLNKLYPQENAGLADEICAGRGCIISELPLATPPSPGTFPRRNRLVAAAGLGTLVIEAGERSGLFNYGPISRRIRPHGLRLAGPN